MLLKYYYMRVYRGRREMYVLSVANHALDLVGNLDVRLLGAVLQLFGH